MTTIPFGRKTFDARDVVLAGISLCAFMRGLVYTVPGAGQPSFALDRIGAVIPLQVYGVLWLIAGVWGFIESVRHKRGRRPLLMQCGLFTFWGTSYILSAPFAEQVERGLGMVITGVFFLSLAIISGGLTRLIALPKLPIPLPAAGQDTKSPTADGDG